ncbi:MAG: hypothetical protein WC755_00460 [Candidatus Woesearchaeota archaeon]|jgi:hypothetical protein
MVSSTIVGAFVILFVVLMCILGYYLFRWLFRANSKEISIYVDKRTEDKKDPKVTNTPFKVESEEKTRLSTKFLDDDVITKIKKNPRIKES